MTTDLLTSDRKKRWQNKPSKRRVSELILAYGLVLPSILVILGTVIYPVFFLFRLSLSEVKFQQGQLVPIFSGFGNFQSLMSDASFMNASYRTFIFVVYSVPISLLLGLVVALALNNVRRGAGLVRIGVLLPWLVPPVVAGLIWRWMFHDQFGLINWIFVGTGILAEKQAWMAEVSTAMPAVIWVDIWANTPMVAIILLAGLQIIPDDLYEAAKVDGADVIQRLWYVTLPFLRPHLLIALLLRTMFALRTFDIIVLLAGSKFGSASGAPAGTTQVYSLLIWQRTIEHLKFESAAAIAVIVLILTIVISIVYIAVLRTESPVN